MKDSVNIVYSELSTKELYKQKKIVEQCINNNFDRGFNICLLETIVNILSERSKNGHN